MANDTSQQYIEIGSNIYLGTKDGMKYNLLQTADNRLRLVEARSESKTDSTLKGSFGGTVLNVENLNSKHENATKALPSSNIKTIRVMAAQSKQSPCKGQGDEMVNYVTSSIGSLSSINESDNTFEEALAKDEIPINSNKTARMTYTTLLPRQKNNGPERGVRFVIPQNSSFCTSSPSFSTPFVREPPRYAKKKKIQLVSPGAPFSPIPKVRLGAPRQRRPRQSNFQYNPQILHSTINASDLNLTSNGSSMSLSGISAVNLSSSNSSKATNSLEYPKVPNNTPTSSNEDTQNNGNLLSMNWTPTIESEVENYMGLLPREIHNEKERQRRLRIKNSCQYMRMLLPCVSEKTDNATVFERSAHFIAFLRETVGNQHDTEFMEENYIF